MVDVGQTLNNRYRLLSLEGTGGMAAVYKAQDLALKRLVAVKILHGGRNVGDAFQQEAQAAAKMPHPNIVTVYDISQDQEVSYIVMEYVQGPTLRDLIVAEAPFGIDRALNIAAQICNAVEFIHQQGVIHCDLKPLNILVLPDENIKITDFGIARDLAENSTTQQKKAWGTAHYASPELISGKPLTPASDVYAIGIILYEMLTGVRPFDGSNAAEIARQHILDAPPPIQTHNPRIPRYICQVLDRALLKEPAKRYRTAGQMGKLLAAYRQHGEASTQPLPSQDVIQQATPPP
ncbi:MAG: serine/threonine protein kinase, partial [Anaerolineae bacterium]|nr:serine/threonine protein kinase [Anaerolineae bacterium]